MARLDALHDSDNTSRPMFMNSGQQQQGSMRRVRLVPGSTFDGVAFQIALSDAAFDYGSSANIRRGKLLGADPLVVAVKVFGEILDPVKQELLVRELRFAKDVSLCHPLILAFLGTAIVGEQTALVSLYMSNGNLMEYIKGIPGCDKKKLILQVAEAVEFLHDTARLVHGDLKCANVLISDFGDALLADFGLSTFAEKSQFASATMTAIRQMNTLQFAAPELLLGDGAGISSKTCESDVYAFGMLVLEALSEAPPWPNQSNLSVMRKVCCGEHPARPTAVGSCEAISQSWWDTCRKCWSFDPRDRPPINNVLSALRDNRYIPHGPSYRFISTPLDDATVKQLRLLKERGTFVEYAPDGNIIVLDGDFVGLYDVRTNQTLWLSQEDSPAERFAVSPDFQRIPGSGGEMILIWDIASRVLAASIDHDDWVCCVAYSPDGTRIVSAGGLDRVRMRNENTGTPVGRLARHMRYVALVSFSFYGTCIAFASAEGIVYLSDGTTGAPIGTMERSAKVSSLFSICFSPDGKQLVAGCSDGVIAVWDAYTRQLVRIIGAESAPVGCIVFSPSGRHIASGSKGDIRIWDAQSWNQIGSLPIGHAGFAKSIAFSPDGKTLVSAANDGVVRVHDLQYWTRS